VEPAGADSGRDRLIAAILDFFGGQDLLSREEIRAALEREIAAAEPQALVDLKMRVTADDGWAYYAPDALARRIHHRLADRFLTPDSQLFGAEHFAAVGDAPVVIVANHLSYADANVIDILLRRADASALADRLTALAGPKVFTSRERRFSSLCFGTIKVPQSADVSSEDAVLNAREVARAARRAIDAARLRLAAGDALVLFAEGTRSRRAAMQPMLAAVARYFEDVDAWVLPVGLEGPEALFPVEDSTLHPARVVMRVGNPFKAKGLLTHAREDRRVVMDAVGLAIADLVSPAYRGAYANAADYPAASAALSACRV
jgi:1-acyl-sn-glycerol-3-phosphate acyltransferase